MKESRLWRVSFAAAGVLITAGGVQHPRGGGMAAMLADPVWVPAHSLITLGFAALLAGIVLHRRAVALGPRTRRWSSLAIAATALQLVEMVLHTAAAVDAGNLAAGAATPVFTTHTVMAVVSYPLFALAMIGLIWVGMRERTLGSPWIGWLGIVGAAAHGAAAVLVPGLGLLQFSFLFPMLMLFALWALLAAFWPVRAAEGHAAAPVAAGEPVVLQAP